MNDNKNITVTQHRIGSMTYLVVSAPSENAKDTIQTKIEKLIIKDINLNGENASQFSDLK